MQRIEGVLLHYLVNGLWQPIVIVFGAFLCDLAIRRTAPRFRYLLWMVTLLLCAITPALPSKLPVVPNGAATFRLTVNGANGLVNGRGRQTAEWITGLYGVYIFFQWFRLWQSLRRVRELRLQAEPAAPGISLSDAITAPITFGFRQPLILLPRRFASTAGAETLDAVIAHEKAHWTRSDYASNLVLLAITAPVRFHPVVQFAYARLAAMREFACDELASANTPAYAERLLEAARVLMQGPPEGFAEPVGLGLFDCDYLEERVMKLNNPAPALSVWTARILTAVVSLALATDAVYMSTHYTAFAQQAHKVGPGVTPPKLVYKVEPSYDQSAKEEKVSGTVVLSLVVTKEGLANQIAVKRSLDPRLDDKAIEAVQQWRFQPGQKDGEDVDVQATIEVNFRLK